MSNVQQQSLENTALDIDEAAEAILGRWSDGDDLLSEDEELEASEEDIDETDDNSEYEEEGTDEGDEEDTEVDPDEEEDTDEDDDEEYDQEDDEEEDQQTPSELSDDTTIEVVVDGETKQASIKELKRLYGQEASLTRKSQEVAAKRKEAEEVISRADASYRKLLEKAESRFKQYEGIDMLVASRTLSTEDFAALRQEAKQAEEEYKFLTEEATAFYQQNQQAYQQQLQAAAKECVSVLEKDIEGWSNDLYNEIRHFAVSQGLPQEQVDQYVDPNVIKILNKARLYDKMKSTAETKKAKASMSKSKKNTKVLRSKKAPPSQSDVDYQRRKQASNKLRSNPSQAGDLDDIADALLARWER